ncbi:MAG: hypothetical protein KJN71_08950 [Acidimicrobiia bacterium]|nr:hypothetical protein [Acidimicrobiia bacterium]NNC74588.1 hypothetical protein [Acidimicrobiia bacterium]
MSLFAVSLIVALSSGAPGDALELTPGPAPAPAAVATPTPPRDAPAHGHPFPWPGDPTLAGLMAAALALRATRRPEDEGVGAAPLAVFVSGHGNETTDFDPLLTQMGLGSDEFVHFDWRATRLDLDHATASTHASVAEAAGDLHSLLQGLAASGRPIYLVGFSKGGATIAELLSWWDQDETLRVANVYGAALLDPPIADGFLGFLQSAGHAVGPVPDNGRFDTHRCDKLGCRDVRDHLGAESGVELIIIRNPDAWVTNVRDRIRGVRMYDLDHDGGEHAARELLGTDEYAGHPLSELVGNVIQAGWRVVDAHNSVLAHPEVAQCLIAEIRRPGDCDETWAGGRRWPIYSGWISGGGGTPRL